MHASRSRAKVQLMPDLAFPGDLPVCLDDGQTQVRIRDLMRVIQGKIKPATRAQIGEVCRWHGVTAKALHNLEERGITQSERGPSGIRFYTPEQQTRIDVTLALRELGASAQDIRDFLDLLAEDRAEARGFLTAFLNRRLALLQDRAQQISDALTLVQDSRAL